MKEIAIVTGASGGFGGELSKILADKIEVEEVWAFGRDEDKLEELKKVAGEKIIPFALDLTDRRAYQHLEDLLQDSSVSVKYLVNNAGYGKFCSYNELSMDQSLNMIDLNVSSVVALTLTVLPYMLKGSHIINVASQASFQPLPFLNIYAATKAFVRSYSRALNVELKARHISVTAVCPGWMKTSFLERVELTGKEKKRTYYGLSSAQKVAKKAVRDADHYRDMSVYGFFTKVCHVAAKLLPQSFVMKLWGLLYRP